VCCQSANIALIETRILPLSAVSLAEFRPYINRTRTELMARGFRTSTALFQSVKSTHDGHLAIRTADRPVGDREAMPAQTSRVRSRPPADGSRTPGTLRFRVDLPANHLGPGWRKRAG